MSYNIDSNTVILTLTLSFYFVQYRMVRRMLANCGYPVVELRRERHGSVTLGDLSVGEFREPTKQELEWAEELMK